VNCNQRQRQRSDQTSKQTREAQLSRCECLNQTAGGSDRSGWHAENKTTAPAQSINAQRNAQRRNGSTKSTATDCLWANKTANERQKRLLNSAFGMDFLCSLTDLRLGVRDRAGIAAAPCAQHLRSIEYP
jgi:hypothetical protein